MLKKIISFCKSLVAKVVTSTKRFPEAIALSIALVAIIITLNHHGADIGKAVSDLLTRVGMVLALGIPVFLSLRILWERILQMRMGKMILAYAAAIGTLVVYFFFFLKDFSMISMMRYIAISMPLYIIFTFIPCLYRKDDYELYIIKLLTRFFITYIFSVILFLGLAAMLFTINALFSVHISEKFYFDLWLIVVGVFATAFFLADIPREGENFAVEEYPKWLKVLLLYIVMPMLAVYAVILYAYFAKIIVTTHWPKGIVSNLVLWYTFISTFVIFLTYPLRKLNSWVEKFIRFFPRLVIPLLGMMFVAMGIRVNAYGITENRYYVVLGGLWITGCMLYFTFRKNARNINLAISLALISFLSVVGPWSSFAVSKYSQNARFEKLLTHYGMLKDGRVVKAHNELTSEGKKEISSIVLYFSKNHSLNDLRYIPKGFKLKQAKQIFGFEISDERYYSGGREYFSDNVKDATMALDVKGYDYFLQYYPFGMTESVRLSENVRVVDAYGSKQMRILENGKEIYARKITDIALKMHKKLAGKVNPDIKDMTYTDQNEKVKIRYVFTSISGMQDKASGDITITSTNFYLFIKLKNK